MELINSLIIGISIAAIPGPMFFELTKRTLKGGFSQGFLFILGNIIGHVVLSGILFFGVSSFLTNKIFESILFFIGGSILVWLGITGVIPKNNAHVKKHTFTVDNSLLIGIGITISSPIIIAFWISMSGTYLAGLSTFLAYTNMLFISLGFLVFELPFAGLIHITRKKIPEKYVHLLSKIFGIVLIVYGLSFFYKLFQ